MVGTYLLEGLLSLRDEFPDSVGDVRGKGMMMGVELISDRVSLALKHKQH